MNIRQIYTNNKGFTTQEVIISIIIIILFISIITGGFYNYYISIQANTRRAVASNIIIDVIENVEIMNYDDITTNNIDTQIQKLKSENVIPNNYKIQFTLNNYNQTEGNQDKKDLIKILTVSVKYTVGNKEENYEITRLIKR